MFICTLWLQADVSFEKASVTFLLVKEWWLLMASSRGKVIFLVRVQRRERLTTFQMVAKVDSHFVAVFWWMSKTFFTVWANFLVLLNWWMLFNKHNIHNSQRNNYLETDHIVLHPKSAFNASILSLFFAFFFLFLPRSLQVMVECWAIVLSWNVLILWLALKFRRKLLNEHIGFSGFGLECAHNQMEMCGQD